MALASNAQQQQQQQQHQQQHCYIYKSSLLQNVPMNEIEKQGKWKVVK